MKRLFFQSLVSFDFLKSILDDAIVDIKMIFKFWAKNIIFRYFLRKGYFVIYFRSTIYFFAVPD